MSDLSGPIAPFADAVGSPQTSPAVRELVKQIGEPPRITEYPDSFHFNFPAAGVELYFERGICLTCFLYTQPESNPDDPAGSMAAMTSAPIDGLPALATAAEIRAKFGAPADTGTLLGTDWLRYQIGDRSLNFRLDENGRTSIISVTHLVPGTDIHGEPVADTAERSDEPLEMTGQYEADDDTERVTFRSGYHRMIFTRHLREARPVSLHWDFETFEESCIMSVALDDEDAFLLQITDEAAAALDLPTRSRFRITPRSDALELLNAIIWMLRGTGEFAPAADDPQGSAQ